MSRVWGFRLDCSFGYAEVSKDGASWQRCRDSPEPEALRLPDFT